MGKEAAGALVSPVESSSSRRGVGVGEETFEVQSGGAESPLLGPEQATPHARRPELARIQPRVRFTPISENRNPKKRKGADRWRSRREPGAWEEAGRCP